MKIYTNELGHMTNMAAITIYGNNLNNLLLQNQSTNDLETRYDGNVKFAFRAFIREEFMELVEDLGAEVNKYS